MQEACPVKALYLPAGQAMHEALELLLVLGLTCAGLKTPALVAWSRRNVVLSKLLLGVLFLGMIALMILLR